ncbi:uncharacterized protein E0L32_004277 [Thyridium curvatum]|uniref:Cullin family profile domain-containing protein n=1 Tax=Thyridium curvatum TaxID=1093900 RepID=A0A507BE71_9PEZI|nr:uncharacterized protein E0L32_004277 [Thyridium curvatum]TPX15579.1 hypothetical protein E0L32_004277 [Thyridium curvatum]
MMQGRGKIRAPRRGVGSRDNADFDQCWALISDAISDIHTQNAGRLSFEQLYRASYKIVLKKKGDQLYNKVKEFEENWFSTRVVPEIFQLITRNLVAVALHDATGTSANERRAIGEKFLRGLRDAWEAHNRSMNMVADFLMYLDRGYATDSKRPSIYTVTIGLFRDHVLRTSLAAKASEGEDLSGLSAEDLASRNIFDVLNAVILDQINMEREGDVVDRTILRDCVAMLETLYVTDLEEEHEKLYITGFEECFLHDSRAYYRNECQKLVREGNASVWLRHTKRRLTEEQDRCATTLSKLSLHKILKVVQEELIMAHLDDFLAIEGTGLRAMLDNDRFDDLSILYHLISLVDPDKNALKSVLQKRVIGMGMEIEQELKNTDFSVAASVGGPAPAAEGAEKAKVQPLSQSAQQTAAAIKWVNDIVQLKEKFDKIWTRCFEEDMLVQSSLTKGFTELFTLCKRSAEYVSLFIDDSFKRGVRGKSDVEIDAILDKSITMIRFLTDKDMFQRYYQKHLARRLLHNKSENPEVETQMLARMQLDLGKNFTTKFEGMFKDMKNSEDLTSNYQKYVRGLGDLDSSSKVELGINVLTTNNWPSEVMGRSGDAPKTQCNYPPDIQRLQKSFFTYYLKDRSGRQLTWVGSAGTAEIKCLFPKISGQDKGPLSRERRYELTVPTFGMVVLMLFNDVADGEGLLFEEIQAATNIPTADLTRALASLSIPPKSRVLLKEPMTKSVKSGDKFSFNTQFVSKTLKIKAPVINAVSKVEGEEERKDTEEKNGQMRNFIIDAVAVRIMKQRKELPHSQLVSEIITMLVGRFQPEVSMVKKRIEDLIVREYLERIEDAEVPSYRYLA